MKKLLSLISIALAVVVSSCSKFDDSAIWDKLNEQEQTLNDHEKRIAALEELCKQMNTNINALQTLVEALEKRDYITNVSPVRKDGEVIGYTISFADSDTITIYHGENGQDGADGKDGYTPQIGVMKDTDGIYYWTIDGEWLLDGKGNKIQANGVNGIDGTDGSNGEDGTNGVDGITPRLKIENDYWYVSYDEGATWIELGKATGEDGSHGVIIKVEESETEVVFTLTDGSSITLPKSKKTDELSENNKIYYTTTDGKKLFPNKIEPEYFNAILVSNTYKDNMGVLIFDDEVTMIGYSSFEDCDRLTSITIPSSVIQVQSRAFYGCTSLESVYCLATLPPEGASQMFYNNATERNIYVPTESVDLYKSTSGWQNYSDNIIGRNFE